MKPPFRVRSFIPRIAFAAGISVAMLVPASTVPAGLHAEEPAERAIGISGNPASLVVWGDARASLAMSDGTVLAAKTSLGEGSVAAIGHGGFLSSDVANTQEAMFEQIRWLAERTGKSPVRAWGLPDWAARTLEESGIGVDRVDSSLGDLRLAEVDLLVGSPQAFAGAGRLDELEVWVRGGGALLSVETAWGQLQLGRAASVEDLAANRLLVNAGVMYTDRVMRPDRRGLYRLDPAAPEASNATLALRVLAGEADGDARLAGLVARRALEIAPLDSNLVAEADRLASLHAAELERAYASMAERALSPADDPLAVALLDLDARRVEPGRAHPSAAAFPGPVPDSMDRVSRTVSFDDAIPGWRTTGLYAAPGETVRVCEVGGGGEGLVVQIGSWLDQQRFEERVRMPRAVFRTPVEPGGAKAFSPIGGPVYIDIAYDRAESGPVEVLIEGAVEMPRFRLGHTDLDEWRSRIRSLPVAWAELESDKLAFTLPAEVVRELDRPDLVMQHWDRVHDTMQAMEPRTERHWNRRQYRYVAERRLSFGYMYCPQNAPIVIPEGAAGAMVDMDNFNAEGPNRLWGHYHEMGHAHQNRDWTFEGTGEVTVNIFTVLVLNTLNGYPLDAEATRTSPRTAWETFDRHKQDGAPFDRWKREPFLALQTYAMLWHKFGWEAFRETFRSYDDLPTERRPRTDDDKRDLFVEQFSRTVGRNLAPYFTAWGVPLSEGLDERLADLPVWMPQEP
ncbi:MAG: hypothetical protein EA423_12050 [Phycisphaerales bacterium]|nr:MAG: hypothetical protein EA423_12050 [Phycisphaerales bacterium]